MGYYVSIRSSNQVGWLCRGKLVSQRNAATWYTAPSAAKKAYEGFLRRNPGSGFVLYRLERKRLIVVLAGSSVVAVSQRNAKLIADALRGGYGAR